MSPTDQTQKWKPGDVVVVPSENYLHHNRYIVVRVTKRYVYVEWPYGGAAKERRLDGGELRRARPESDRDRLRDAQERLKSVTYALGVRASHMRTRITDSHNLESTEAAITEIKRLCAALDNWTPPGVQQPGEPAS